MRPSQFHPTSRALQEKLGTLAQKSTQDADRAKAAENKANHLTRLLQQRSSGQSLFGGGVPGRCERIVPAALRYVVGAATDRISRSRVSEECLQIITETGFRVHKELTPMKKDQVDLQNALSGSLGDRVDRSHHD